MSRLDAARVLAHRDVRAMVARDTIGPIAARVAKLLSHDRRIAVARRYLESRAAATLTAGLTVGEVKVRETGVGVHLVPTEGFGLHAYPGDVATEQEAWDRWHLGDRADLVEVTFKGGLPNDGPARNDQLVIRRWTASGNQCEEVVVAFDYGPDRHQIREDAGKRLWVGDGHDPADWDRLADAAWALGDHYREHSRHEEWAAQRERYLTTVDQVLGIAYGHTETATRG